MTGSLGCGRWKAFIDCRGGGELESLPFSTLSMSRRVDDMSDGSVTLQQTRLQSFDPIEQARCCGILADLEPWEHELAMWRDSNTTENPTWVGPVVKPTWDIDSVTIDARDLFQWFERRWLDRDRSFENTDLADIFEQYLSDGLHHDPSPNIQWSAISATGITGDRELQAIAGTRAADALRELARSGVDFTMLGRELRAGGTEIPTADLGRLTNAELTDIALEVDGLQTETESIVLGARASNVLGPVRASAGGVDPDRGLVQGITTESDIEDESSAQAAADSRNALLGESPTFITARLVPTAPVSFEDLIPGAVANLRLQLMCKTVVGNHRLTDVRVSVDDEGTEAVVVNFSSLGTSEEIV